MLEECDKCGRDLTVVRVLWADRIQTAGSRLGQYGRDCMRAVVGARARHGMATFNADGLELDAAARIVPGQSHG